MTMSEPMTVKVEIEVQEIADTIICQLTEDGTLVEVVRCKDCRWGKEVSGNIECLVNDYAEPMYHGYYWYCANGERKDDAVK